MSSHYITIREACELTGRSESTIRRNITNIASLINKKEGVNTVIKDKRVFKIDYSYLVKKYPTNSQKETATSQKKNVVSEEVIDLRETIKMYSIMLEEKDKQIEQLKSELNEYKEDKMFLKDVNKSLIVSLDQSQKLFAIDKKVSFLK